ncbi:DUF192 domain-containing protein [Thermus thermamylovorans]|uniref:DUF192 domain-containing protein n=1 Tax=Thermus thermamylovorans TaxID=2509362 RepID=A0A4Q9B2G1_9DEIN|nr:DUF192 domain-containing protein [Thermus thermamylovorans]TBH17469.1 DUF192 domain-containing protein [Thermus thermamylovorans]
MAPRRWALLALFLLLGVGFALWALQRAPGEGPAFPRSTLWVEGEGVRHHLRVEVADTPERQARGLMFREALAEDEGMVFLFPAPTAGGFWMKNTLIPLSIAFFDREGMILRILDMEPCRADPCPVYHPGVIYQGALEVNQGWFARHGLTPGARVGGEALGFWPR